MKEVVVTTSWDDGHKLDLRVAKMLEKYNLPGTFYIAPRDREFEAVDRLTDAEIKNIAKSFEIGAHTMTHPRLPKVSDGTAGKEITESKKYLEKVTGKQVSSFCYPGGSYKARHVRMVREAGFRYARTVRRHAFGYSGFPFEARTTIHTYNHFLDLWKIAKFARFNPVRTVRYFQWDVLSKAIFDSVCERGGVFHLWGHSWEIDNHGDWEKLESVLRYISGRKNVRYVTNAELATVWPKRLLLAMPYFPPHFGGMEVYGYHVAQALQRLFGWEVVVVTSGGRGLVSAQSGTLDGLRVYRLPYWIKVSNTPVNPLWFFSLRRIIKREHITLVNTHAPVPFMSDVVIRAAGEVPSVMTYHTVSMRKGRASVDWLISFYEKQILPRTLRACRYIICASPAVRDTFLRAYRECSDVVSPGVDTDLFTPSEKQPGHEILFNGSLEKTNSYKGLDRLLEAFAIISEKMPEARLTVVGFGSGMADYLAMAERYDITDRVHFTGRQDRDALPRIYRQADIFALPTRHDNFPLVILEAMSSGLPVVSTPIGAIPTIIDDMKTGYLVPPNDVENLAAKLVGLLAHPEQVKRLGRAGRVRAEQKFSWNEQTRKTNRLFLEVLGMTAEDSDEHQT